MTGDDLESGVAMFSDHHGNHRREPADRTNIFAAQQRPIGRNVVNLSEHHASATFKPVKVTGSNGDRLVIQISEPFKNRDSYVMHATEPDSEPAQGPHKVLTAKQRWLLLRSRRAGPNVHVCVHHHISMMPALVNWRIRRQRTQRTANTRHRCAAGPRQANGDRQRRSNGPVAGLDSDGPTLHVWKGSNRRRTQRSGRPRPCCTSTLTSDLCGSNQT